MPMAIHEMRMRATRVSPHVRKTMSKPLRVTDSVEKSARTTVVASRSHSRLRSLKTTPDRRCRRQWCGCEVSSSQMPLALPCVPVLLPHPCPHEKGFASLLGRRSARTIPFAFRVVNNFHPQTAKGPTHTLPRSCHRGPLGSCHL